MYRDRGEADREARRQREAWEREHGESFSRILCERYEATRSRMARLKAQTTDGGGRGVSATTPGFCERWAQPCARRATSLGGLGLKNG